VPVVIDSLSTILPLNIYGEGLTIERLEKGTRISFVINHNKNLAFIEAGERYELLNN